MAFKVAKVIFLNVGAMLALALGYLLKIFYLAIQISMHYPALIIRCLQNLLPRADSANLEQPAVEGLCHFTRLPIELRLKIFGLVLQRDRIHLPEKSTSRPFRWIRVLFWKKAQAVNHVHGQVLRVCKLFEREGTVILYGRNVFRISGEELVSFDYQILRKVGRKNVAMLRHIEIDELRESNPDAIASELSTIAHENPELANLHSLALLAADSRFPEESDHGDMDGTYNGGPTSMLPHLSKLVVMGHSMTLTVEQSATSNEEAAMCPGPSSKGSDDLAVRVLKRTDKKMRDVPNRISSGHAFGTPASIILRLWSNDRWTSAPPTQIV